MTGAMARSLLISQTYSTQGSLTEITNQRFSLKYQTFRQLAAAFISGSGLRKRLVFQRKSLVGDFRKRTLSDATQPDKLLQQDIFHIALSVKVLTATFNFAWCSMLLNTTYVPYLLYEMSMPTLTREKQQQQRTLRRQDKKMKELLTAVDEERKQADQFKQMVC